MLQGVFLNEQKGLPWVFSLCFKQKLLYPAKGEGAL